MAEGMNPVGHEAVSNNPESSDGSGYNPHPAEDQSKCRIIKNLLMVCLAIFMYQTTSLPCTELQSSINMAGGLGTATNSIQTGVQIIGLILLPTMFIRLLGLKYTICIGLISETMYFLINIYPRWYTLVPAAIICGLMSTALWPAKSSYITHVSHLYAAKVGANFNSVVNRFFGLFYMLYYFGYILGNVFSHYVLESESNNTDIGLCGANFCDYNVPANNTNFQTPSQMKLFFLFGGFALVLFTGAILVFIFLDQVYVGPRLEVMQYLKLSVSTMYQFRYKNQILLTPINFYRGLSSGFIASDYTKAYVTCSWGVYQVGFVMLTYGACCGVASFTFGLLVKKIGRLPIFIVAVVAHVTVITILFTWKPNPEESYMFFVVAGLWGVGHSCWESQIAALHGILYPKTKEQAFSCYVVAENLGNVVAFAVSSALCVYVKLSMVSVFLTIAFVSFLCVEIPLMRRNNNTYVTINDT